jgi:hypothetical protein
MKLAENKQSEVSSVSGINDTQISKAKRIEICKWN